MSASLEKISDVSSIQFLQGDWALFDIDYPLSPQTIKTIKELQDRKITVFCFTSTAGNKAEQIIQQLTSLGVTLLPFNNPNINKKLENIKFSHETHIYKQGVLFASQIDDKGQKANVLGLFMKHVLASDNVKKPRRIVIIDSSRKELTQLMNKAFDIFTKDLPLGLSCFKLFHLDPNNFNIRGFPLKNSIFPEDLSQLEFVGHLDGGTGGVDVLQNAQGFKFALKSGNSESRMKDEILSDALYRLYRSGKVSVPDFAVYHSIPSQLANTLNLPMTGTYRLSIFIDADPHWYRCLKMIMEGREKELKNDPHWQYFLELISKQMSSSYVFDAFLGNNDIANHWFNILIDKNGRVWHIDNGSTLRYWGRGELKGDTNSTAAQLESFLRKKLGQLFYGNLTEKEKKEQAKKILEMAPKIIETIELFHSILHFEKYNELVERFYDSFEDLRRVFALDIPLYPQKYMKAYAGATASGMVLYCFLNKVTYLFLVKRKNGGLWGIPGGYSESVDSLLMDSASRETFEETKYLRYIGSWWLSHRSSVDLITKRKTGIFRYRTHFVHIVNQQYRELNKYLKKIPEEEKEITEICCVRAIDIQRALENPEFVTSGEEQVLQVKALTAEGDLQELLLHPPFYTLMQQGKVKPILESMIQQKSLPIESPSARWVRSPMVHPISARHEIAMSVMNHNNLVQFYKSLNSSSAVEYQEKSAPIQSDIHFQAMLGKRFKHGNSDENIDALLEMDLGEKAKNTKRLVGNILAEEHRKGKIVLYHATSDDVGYFYDLFTQFLKMLYGIAHPEFKAFRLFDHHFTFDTVQDFISHFLKIGGNSINNHKGRFHEVGLSVNPFLLGNFESETSSTWKLFTENFSRNPPEVEQLFIYIKNMLNLSETFMEYLINCSKPSGGRLYQIFIDESIVDEIVYPAGILGSLNELEHNGEKIRSIRKILSILREDPKKYAEYIRTLQCRIYLKPEIMQNTDLVQVKEYFMSPPENERGLRKQIEFDMKQMAFEMLASNRALIPGTFRRKSALIMHNDLLCAYNGLEKENMTQGMHLALLLKINDVEGLRRFIEMYPSINLKKVPNPNYMEAGMPDHITAAELIGEGPRWWETYFVLLCAALRKSSPKFNFVNLESVEKHCPPILALLNFRGFQQIEKIINTCNGYDKGKIERAVKATSRFITLYPFKCNPELVPDIFQIVIKNIDVLTEDHFSAFSYKSIYRSFQLDLFLEFIFSLPLERVLEIVEALDLINQKIDPFLFKQLFENGNLDLLKIQSGKAKEYVAKAFSIFEKANHENFPRSSISMYRALGLAQSGDLWFYVNLLSRFIPSQHQKELKFFFEAINAVTTGKLEQVLAKQPFRYTLTFGVMWVTYIEWIFLKLTKIPKISAQIAVDRICQLISTHNFKIDYYLAELILLMSNILANQMQKLIRVTEKFSKQFTGNKFAITTQFLSAIIKSIDNIEDEKHINLIVKGANLLFENCDCDKLVFYDAIPALISISKADFIDKVSAVKLRYGNTYNGFYYYAEILNDIDGIPIRRLPLLVKTAVLILQPLDVDLSEGGDMAVANRLVQVGDDRLEHFQAAMEKLTTTMAECGVEESVSVLLECIENFALLPDEKLEYIAEILSWLMDKERFIGEEGINLLSKLSVEKLQKLIDVAKAKCMKLNHIQHRWSLVMEMVAELD